MKWLIVLIILVLSPSAVPAAPSKSDPPKRLYDRVMKEFQERDYEAALAGFRFFLALHAKSPLASSAQYWIGECEFRLGRYREAIQSFELVLSRYPSSPKQASATLKKALTYEKLGQVNESRILLERIAVDFPNTQEAELAKKALRKP
ncbi:MAG: tol-pal system protein YbgF [Nitrospiraceae bacterium]